MLPWRLFLRDVSAKLRYAALGVLWAVITPLFLVGLLLALKYSDVVRAESSGNLPYVVFAITGVTIWGLFATGINSAAESLNSAGATMLRMNFPRAALVLAALGMGLFEFLVRLPVAIGVWLWYGCDASPVGGIVRGRGLLLGIELVRSKETGEPNQEATARFSDECRARGLLTGWWPVAYLAPNIVRLMPPYTITRDECDEALDIVQAALKATGNAGCG